MEELGHEVIRLQEQEVSWSERVVACRNADVFWWTQTYGYAQTWNRDEAMESLLFLNERLPTVGFHLDLWHGLPRADQLEVEPFFQVRDLFTADGDHDEEWKRLGINHHWLPPAVYGAECFPGTPRERFLSDIAFVGNWNGNYHPEHWPERQRLLDWLYERYRGRFARWPQGRAVRGADLNDLYASVKIVVGDSCFASSATRYMSDRLFETVGRGGFLVFPRIPAATEMLTESEHCRFWTPGDWNELQTIIDHYLVADEERERIRRQGQEFVREHHTYKNRVTQVLETIGMLEVA